MKQCSSLNRNILLLGVVACLIAAGIPATLAATDANALPATGCTIIVISYPDGAAVWLNGEYRGVTPAEFRNIPAGEYNVTVSLDGYYTEITPSTMSDGVRRQIMIQLEKISSGPRQTATPSTLSRYGTIAVDSTPGGAFVTLDGVAAGRTPMTHAALILNSVPVGNHTINVELAGYPPYTATVNVIKNHVSQVNVELSKSSQPVTSVIPASVVLAAPASGVQTTPTRKSGVPPAVIIGAVAVIGIAAVFRRS